MQSTMRTQVFYAKTIDEAATEVLQLLKEEANTTRNVGSRHNVFYFDGWDGLGASSVLRSIAQRLTATSPAGKRALAEQEFDQVIHIDCSMWESRRVLQRAVAQQLKLPDGVMELFDMQDEEDDFKGVPEGSRAELQEVIKEVQRHIQNLNCRLLMIFHNGSSEDIDLESLCGLPLYGFSTSKVLWTFQGRFRLKPRLKVDRALESSGMTDVFFSAVSSFQEHIPFPPEIWSYLVQKEASEVAQTTRPLLVPAKVAECFLYMLKMCCRGHHSIDFDWATHGANYWVCDGIIQQLQRGDRDAGTDDDNDESWRSADALQCEVPLDVDYTEYLPSSHLTRFVESNACWVSPNYGFNRISAGAIPNGDTFQQHYFNKLRVLKLSRCTFSFQSPPFVSCHSLRFLWLDHCQGTGSNTDEEGKEEDIRRCFQRLWVLDMRSTDCGHILSAQMLDLMTQLKELNVMGAEDWDIGQLQGRLPNIRKLRVKKSRVRCSSPENDPFSEMNKMELLYFSGNSIIDSSMRRLSGPGAITNSSCLETVIISDGFWLPEMYLRGCTKLKNLLLQGWLGNVRTIDISGTAVKTLDLTTTRIWNLDELYLLGCEKLCAITWPPKDVMTEDLHKLCIDTTQSAPTAQSRNEKGKQGTTATTSGTSVAASVPHGTRPTSEFDWHISVRDARLLKSLEPVYSDSREIYVEVSSPTTISAGGIKDQGIRSGSSHEQVNLCRHLATAVYGDITVDDLQQQACEDDDDAGDIMGIWPCPDVPCLPQESCYMHIQDRMTKTELLPQGGGQTSGTTITVPLFVSRGAKILHVHDSMSITSTPSILIMDITMSITSSEWPYIEWCRIERCPRLDSVFNTDYGRASGFTYELRTFWASQLLKSRYISTSNGHREYPHLTFLHLDLCPRLIHVLPLCKRVHGQEDSFRLLETLEIIWCSDLKEIFPLDTGYDYKPVTFDFPSLKHIHLHELPSLKNICGVRMFAPNLETVKIRGCWSLTRLPDVGDGDKAVECDCEKEWWDKLEWDDRSQATRCKPTHPRYYKKTTLRSSVLR